MSSSLSCNIIQDTSPQVTQAFRELTEAMSNSALKGALDDAIKPTAAAYRANLAALNHSTPALRRDKNTGHLVARERIQNVVGTKIWKFPNGTGFAGLVGTFAGAAPHAHLIEDGTVARFRLKIGGKYLWVELGIQSGRLSEKNAIGLRRRTEQMTGTHPLGRAVAATETTAQETFCVRLRERTLAKLT